MSDPLWIGAGKGDTIGAATIATDGTLTLAAHGLVDGEPVRVDTFTGGAVGVLRDDTTYFVVNAALDTFQLVSAPGDEIITYGSTGGVTVYTAAPHYDPVELRRLLSGLLGRGDDADRFGARSGLFPHGNETTNDVTLSGTTWTVHDITGVIYPGVTAQSGAYIFAHPTESASLNPADPTNPRIDALDMQIQDDDEDASGFRRAQVVYVAGTPGATPATPAVTPNSLRLVTILVPAGGVPSPTIETLPPYTAAIGGIIPVRDSSDYPASGGRHRGLALWDMSTNQLVVNTDAGATWVPIARAGGQWETIVDGATVSGASHIETIPSGVYDRIRVHLRGRLDTGPERITMRVNNDSTAGLHRQGVVEYGFDDGGVVFSLANETTVWSIAMWGTASGCNATATIFNTDETAVLSYEGSGTRQGSAANRTHTDSGGDLAATRLLDSLRFGTAGTAVFQSETRLWIEGHRPL